MNRLRTNHARSPLANGTTPILLALGLAATVTTAARAETEIDLAAIAAAWGPCPAPCPADLTGDGVVDGRDVLELMDGSTDGGDALALAVDAPQAIHEALPERIPVDAPDRSRPAPVSLDRPAAFGADNLHDLGVVPQSRIDEADLIHALEYQDIHPGPHRVGFARVPHGGPISVPGAAVREQVIDESGTRLWTLSVRTPGSHRIKLHLANVDLGSSEMVVFTHDQAGEVVAHGPFRGAGPDGDGDFWPPSVPGDVVFIEVRGVDAPWFDIVEVVHFDRDPLTQPIGGGEGGIAGSECTAEDNLLPCHLDVMCSGVNQAAIEATGRMTFINSEGNASNCTGTLLTDLDNETFVPYFLTAYHCVSTQTGVDSLEIDWYFQTVACDSQTFEDTEISYGGTLLVTNDTDDGNDMSFIRLDWAPPGILMAGWTTSSLSSGYGVHHPAGSWKRVTWFEDGSGLCKDPNDFDFYDKTSGATEGGSSGSGIFNSSAQLSGQLFGTCGPGCDETDIACIYQEDYPSVYGEFESTWEDTAVSYWLSLGGTIHVDHDWGPGLPENGTELFPFNTVAEGASASWDGARVLVTAGNYPETPTITTPALIIANGGTVVLGE